MSHHQKHQKNSESSPTSRGGPAGAHSPSSGSTPVPQQTPLLLEKLNRMLEKFGAVSVADIKEYYNYYPDEAKAFLGEGAYGKTYIGKAKVKREKNEGGGKKSFATPLSTTSAGESSQSVDSTPKATMVTSSGSAGGPPTAANLSMPPPVEGTPETESSSLSMMPPSPSATTNPSSPNGPPTPLSAVDVTTPADAPPPVQQPQLVPPPSEPLRVIKKIAKERISKKERQIQHMAAELALSMKMKSPRLNSCIGLYHSPTHVFMVLEMTHGQIPSDFKTRLYYLFGHYDHAKIPTVDGICAKVEEEWDQVELPKVLQKVSNNPKMRGKPLPPDYLGNTKDKFYKRQVETLVLPLLGLGREPSSQCDLYTCIKEQTPIPELKAAVILKQCLQGVEYMHKHLVVHRDIKTENVIVGETRTSEPIKDEQGNIIGVSIQETMDVQLIDFGLAKYMRLANRGTTGTPSPNMYMNAAKTETPFTSASNSEVFNLPSTPGAAGALGGGFGIGSGMPPAAGGTHLTVGGGFGIGAPVASSVRRDSTTSAFGVSSAAQPSGASPPTGTFGVGTSSAPPTPSSGDPFANARMPSQAYEQPRDFQVQVTPCGTELYFSLEMVTGILDASGQKWLTSSKRLPKIDVYACGAMLFRMTNDKAPFVFPKAYRPVSLEVKMQQLQQLMANGGPQFSSRASQQVKDVTMKLMRNDPQQRPSATEALMDPFFRKVGNVFAYDIYLDGRMKCYCPSNTIPSVASSIFSETHSNPGSYAGMSSPLMSSPLVVAGGGGGIGGGSMMSGVGQPPSETSSARHNSLHLRNIRPGSVQGMKQLQQQQRSARSEELDEAKLLEMLRGEEDDGDSEGKTLASSLRVYQPDTPKQGLESPGDTATVRATVHGGSEEPRAMGTGSAQAGEGAGSTTPEARTSTFRGPGHSPPVEFGSGRSQQRSLGNNGLSNSQ